MQQLTELVAGKALKGEVDKSVHAFAQSALSRLDVVTREEFDAQAEILQRTRTRVSELEDQLEALTAELEALTGEH
jgi:BMFP domain-containing protein YqiC